MLLAPSLLWIQYSGIFLEYTEYTDLGIADIHHPRKWAAGFKSG